jgi:subtilisin family serine protease
MGTESASPLSIAASTPRTRTSTVSFTSTNRVVYSQSFVGGDTNDEYGHGTHVAGIAAGADNVTAAPNVTMSFYGVAIDANIINLKVLNGTGSGTDANVIAGIDAAISLKSKYNIRVINLSLGRPVAPPPICSTRYARPWKRPGRRASW